MSTERRHEDRFVVVGVDGSEGARLALAFAAREARLRQVRLHVVHAWSYPFVGDAVPVATSLGNVDFRGEAEELCRRAVSEALGDDPGVEVTTEVQCDLATRALLGAAQGAELLVVGSRGRGGFAGLLLGSVSHQLVSHAPCPVVVVPTPSAP